MEITLLLVDPYSRNTTKADIELSANDFGMYPSAEGIYPKKILKPIVLETVVPRGTEDEFWRGIDQNRPTKFPTTAFSDKSHSKSKKVKTKKNKMMGWIENGPTKILT